MLTVFGKFILPPEFGSRAVRHCRQQATAILAGTVSPAIT